MKIWGHCAKCVDWFSAGDWFNPGARLPVCPSCGMSPTELRYGPKPSPVGGAL